MSLSTEGFTNLGTLKVPSLGVGVTSSNTPLLIKAADLTTAMVNSLRSDWGDLRLSTDAAGNNQLPLDIAATDIAWTRLTSVAADEVIYVWGNKPAAVKEVDTATYGRNAVYSSELRRWNMGEAPNALIDSTGNSGNYATYDVADVTASTGLHGGALEFGSEGGWIDVDAIPEMAGKVHSISSIINISIETGTYTVFSSRFGSEINNQLMTYQSKYYTSRRNAASGGSAISTTGLIFNEWVHVSSVSDGNTLSLYINSNLAATFNLSDLTVDQAGIVNQIGAMHTGSKEHSNFFRNGKIDSLGLSDYAKTPNQISIEYQNQSANDAWWIAEDAGGGGGTQQALTLEQVQQLNESGLIGLLSNQHLALETVEQVNQSSLSTLTLNNVIDSIQVEQLNQSNTLTIQQIAGQDLTLEATEQFNESNTLTASQLAAITAEITEQVNQSSLGGIVSASAVLLEVTEQQNQSNTLNLNQTDGQLLALVAVEQVNETVTVLATQVNSLTLNDSEQVNQSTAISLTQLATLSGSAVEQINQTNLLNIIQTGDLTSLKGIKFEPVSKVFELTEITKTYTLEEI